MYIGWEVGERWDHSTCLFIRLLNSIRRQFSLWVGFLYLHFAHWHTLNDWFYYCISEIASISGNCFPVLSFASLLDIIKGLSMYKQWSIFSFTYFCIISLFTFNCHYASYPVIGVDLKKAPICVLAPLIQKQRNKEKEDERDKERKKERETVSLKKHEYKLKLNLLFKENLKWAHFLCFLQGDFQNKTILPCVGATLQWRHPSRECSRFCSLYRTTTLRPGYFGNTKLRLQTWFCAWIWF